LDDTCAALVGASENISDDAKMRTARERWRCRETNFGGKPPRRDRLHALCREHPRTHDRATIGSVCYFFAQNAQLHRSQMMPIAATDIIESGGKTPEFHLFPQKTHLTLDQFKMVLAEFRTATKASEVDIRDFQ
jgi:hypothetical protein